jgi:hypothetical protein
MNVCLFVLKAPVLKISTEWLETSKSSSGISGALASAGIQVYEESEV